MADEQKEGRPSRLFMVLALVGLGLVVLAADWVLGLIFGTR